MKATVDKCPWTGKLFEDRIKYAKHLKSVRNELKLNREKARIQANLDNMVAELYGLGTTDEIAAWLTANYMKIAKIKGPRWASRKPYILTDDDYVEFEIPPMTFSERCSTTHCAPLGQKHTGWHRETNPHVPEAGWRGRIILRPKGNAYHREYVETNWLKELGVNSGGGGGGPDKLSYELTLFTKDFPKLRIKAAANQILQDHGRPGIDSNGNVLEKPRGMFADY